jgi:uncharacterized membrane protein YeiH
VFSCIVEGVLTGVFSCIVEGVLTKVCSRVLSKVFSLKCVLMVDVREILLRLSATTQFTQFS